jgi:hypothetical protein
VLRAAKDGTAWPGEGRHLTPVGTDGVVRTPVELDRARRRAGDPHKAEAEHIVHNLKMILDQ